MGFYTSDASLQEMLDSGNLPPGATESVRSELARRKAEVATGGVGQVYYASTAALQEMVDSGQLPRDHADDLRSEIARRSANVQQGQL